ncbi:MAG: fumarylacetoacetate hydrolase family protein [Candidatus Verstraetearchaeota archaeon]|nr:fumarylacetoacetate hydrolase family protein [Candidatus Verstraetearchaeota archaeon]
MRFATFEYGSSIFSGVVAGDFVVRLDSLSSTKEIFRKRAPSELPLKELSEESLFSELVSEVLSLSEGKLVVMGSRGEAFRLGEVRLRAPITRPPAVFCLGFNFRSHAPELKRPIPEVPVVFMKPSRSVIGPDDEIVLPKVSSRVDYEVELCVVVGKGGRYVSRSDAYSRIFGYTVLNDITARDIQQRDFALSRPWLRSKGFDTFAPIGPFIVTGEEVGDPMDLSLSLSVNGELRQSSRTSEMIFDVPTVVEYISSFTTLEPGALIAMGTPDKIGQLQDGDVVEATVERIGTLRNRAVLEK